MKAVILSAGQGRRLLPLTAHVPKCALLVGGRSIVRRQVETLLLAGIDEIVVVVGHGSEQVERLLTPFGKRVRTIYNPFHAVSDNLASCWMAREEMDSDFFLLNGDTLFEEAVALRMLEARGDITVAVDRKPEYDADDMKVHASSDRLLKIGKQLPPEESDAEAIGMIHFRGSGPATFRRALESMIHQPGALRHWYLKVVDGLAQEGKVSIRSIEGLRWAEVDTREDLDDAARIVLGRTQVARVD